jgi:hypothetical protein
MSIRTRQQTITFQKPFLLDGIGQVQPAGTYRVEIEEEGIPDLSFAAYRRTATVIYLPSQRAGTMNSYEAAVIDSVDLDAALQRDAMSVNSAVEPVLEETVVDKVSQPSHHGPWVTFEKFAERFRAVGVRLRRKVVH